MSISNLIGGGYRRRLMAAVGRKGPRQQYTVTVYPTSYDTVNISYESIDSSHPIEDALTDSSSSTYCLAYWKKGSSAETYFFLKFDFSSIPADATILSVSATAKGAVQITSTSRVTTRQMQLFSGATAKGDSHGISTTATAYSIVAGSWTRAELQDARMRYYVKRATNSSYYNTDYYLRLYGATMTVTYEI